MKDKRMIIVLLAACKIAEKYLVARGIEHRGTEGRTIVLPALREAIRKAEKYFSAAEIS